MNATSNLGLNRKRITKRRGMPARRSRHPEHRSKSFFRRLPRDGAWRSGPPEPGDADGGSA